MRIRLQAFCSAGTRRDRECALMCKMLDADDDTRATRASARRLARWSATLWTLLASACASSVAPGVGQGGAGRSSARGLRARADRVRRPDDLRARRRRPLGLPAPGRARPRRGVRGVPRLSPVRARPRVLAAERRRRGHLRGPLRARHRHRVRRGRGVRALRHGRRTEHPPLRGARVELTPTALAREPHGVAREVPSTPSREGRGTSRRLGAAS
jgi:hypothetical protein